MRLEVREMNFSRYAEPLRLRLPRLDVSSELDSRAGSGLGVFKCFLRLRLDALEPRLLVFG